VSSFAKAMADNLRQFFGLPAVALAKAGGDGGNRTPVRIRVTAASTCVVRHLKIRRLRCRRTRPLWSLGSCYSFRAATRIPGIGLSLLSSPLSPNRHQSRDVAELSCQCVTFVSIYVFWAPFYEAWSPTSTRDYRFNLTVETSHPLKKREAKCLTFFSECNSALNP